MKFEIEVVLIPEDDSPYDSNAVSAWIQGMLVGYLSRDDAATHRSGVLSLQQKHGTAVAGEAAGLS